MEVDWDEDKRGSVIAERDVDFRKVALIFEGPVVTYPDTRHDYGEERFVSLRVVDGVSHFVVHTDRAGIIRLITAWKGGKNGKRRYQAGLARGA